MTEADYAGRWQFVFFGFTQCPDIWPAHACLHGQRPRSPWQQADDVAPLFVTVDLERNTVPVMAVYVSAFDTRLIGLTGTEAQLAEAAGNFRTWYERNEDAAAPDGLIGP